MRSPAQRNSLASSFVLDMRPLVDILMAEPLSADVIQNAVLDFLRARKDTVLHGAHAYNHYVSRLSADYLRFTADVDIFSGHPEELAEELRQHLAKKFYIALRIRERADKQLYRVYQLRKKQEGGNRNLVDIWRAETLPPSERIKGIAVVTPPRLLALKVDSYHDRKNQPKGPQDLADIRRLLAGYPEYKEKHGEVEEHLREMRVDDAVLREWYDIVAAPIEPEKEEWEDL